MLYAPAKQDALYVTIKRQKITVSCSILGDICIVYGFSAQLLDKTEISLVSISPHLDLLTHPMLGQQTALAGKQLSVELEFQCLVNALQSFACDPTSRNWRDRQTPISTPGTSWGQLSSWQRWSSLDFYQTADDCMLHRHIIDLLRLVLLLVRIHLLVIEKVHDLAFAVFHIRREDCEVVGLIRLKPGTTKKT
jgi:hypothetical protein